MIKGVYCLCISIKKPIEIIIGALGLIKFQLGHYIYVGSALNGLQARLQRHLSTSNGSYSALHWHIDYLLKESQVSIKKIFIKESQNKIECSIANAILDKGISIKGFGSSDCKCVSHLFYVQDFEFLNLLNLEIKPLFDYSIPR